MTTKGLRYVVRRLALAIPTILTIVVLNFALVHLAPGDRVVKAIWITEQ